MTQPRSDLFDPPANARPSRSRPGEKRRYLALFLPWLPAERAFGLGLVPPHRPLALIGKDRGTLRLAATCMQARRLGLVAGMALADARAQVPDLATASYDPEGDAALLTRLVRRAIAFTPTVEAEPPSTLILDIAGAEHLFGGEEALRGKAAAHIAAAGSAEHPLSVETGLADTPEAAAALARFGGSAIGALPIAALMLPEESHAGLVRAGFRHVGDLADLPRAPLTARFGPALPRALDRMLGREDRHLSAPIVRPPLHFVLNFAEPIGREEDVLDSIEHLAGEAMQRLAERDEGGRCFVVRLYRSDGHVAALTVETGAPTRDVARLMRLMRERIDSLADPLDPGFGYDRVALAVTLAEALAKDQARLMRENRRDADVSALTDRLAVRHGEAGISTFGGEDSHVPERAGRLHMRGSRPLEFPALQPGEPPARPLFLLDPPQPVEVLAAVPDGPPRRFRWRKRVYRVRAHEGPERIAREWWRRRDGHDGDPGLTRDYYRVEDEEGHRFWLYRLGLYERETDAPEWYVHGLFA